MSKKLLDVTKKNRTCTVGELRKALKGLDDNIPVSAMAWVVGARLQKDPESRRSLKEGFVKNLVWLELERMP